MKNKLKIFILIFFCFFLLCKNVNSNEPFIFNVTEIESRIIWLSKDAYIFDATYSRYNGEYKRIFQGRGIYMYKKIDNSWKMFSVSSLPIPKKKDKKLKK